MSFSATTTTESRTHCFRTDVSRDCSSQTHSSMWWGESMPKFKQEDDVLQLNDEDFYERLRQKHLEDDLVTGIPTEVQHPSLKPVLRPYQKKGISWMLSRELVPSTLPKHWVKLRSKLNPSQELYFNKHTQLLVTERPKLQPIPKGGLLTDEKGLGKTVEVIALILLNPYRAGTECEASEVDENVPPLGNSTKKDSASTVKCICHKFDSRKSVLTCTLCLTQQHGMCVFRRDVTPEDHVNYICPFCWEFSGRIIDAKTTIVVTPASIKSQWKDEIQRHVADKSFKVFMYEGISSGWVHPTELVKYDGLWWTANADEAKKKLDFLSPARAASPSRQPESPASSPEQSNPLKSVIQ